MALAVLPPSVRTTPSHRGRLTATVRAEDARTIVALRGEADLASQPVVAQVVSQVIAASGGDIVVSTRLDFVDSASLRCVGLAQQLLHVQGRTLTVRAPSRMAAKILGLLGLSHLVEGQRWVPDMAGLVGHAGSRVGHLSEQVDDLEQADQRDDQAGAR